MMSSNSSSTDSGDDFPEVDDYSQVDDLDAVAAELAAELAGHVGPGPGDDQVANPRAGWYPAAPADPGQATAPGQPTVSGELTVSGEPTVPDEPTFPGEPTEPTVSGKPTVSGGSMSAEALAPPQAASQSVAPVQPAASAKPAAPAQSPIPVESGAPMWPAASRSQADLDQNGHPIDQVAVRKLGGFNFLSINQWAGLPRDERARLIKGGLATFLFEGNEVEARPALLWLQRLARSDASSDDERPARRSGR